MYNEFKQHSDTQGFSRRWGFGLSKCLAWANLLTCSLCLYWHDYAFEFASRELKLCTYSTWHITCIIITFWLNQRNLAKLQYPPYIPTRPVPLQTSSWKLLKDCWLFSQLDVLTQTPCRGWGGVWIALSIWTQRDEKRDGGMTYCEGVKARTKREIVSVVVLMEVEVTTHTETAERTGRSWINQLGFDI